MLQGKEMGAGLKGNGDGSQLVVGSAWAGWGICVVVDSTFFLDIEQRNYHTEIKQSTN